MTELPAGVPGAPRRALRPAAPGARRRAALDDGTRKFLFRMADGQTIETVAIPTAIA
jgi:adenine C2-methylase RlmN of 23S rRNA A2503 and tRNA A37